MFRHAALFAPALLALAVAAPQAVADRYRTTQTDYGGVGLLQTPTARFAEEGAFRFNATRVSPYSRYSISVTPVPWLEGTLRYTAMTNLTYGGEDNDFGGDQSNKDKAVDAKLRLYQESRWLPQIALGFVDVGGTGLFSSEYLVASKRFHDLDFSLGIGWGYLGNRADMSNPFGGLRDEDRAGREAGDRGGNFNTSTYFSGPAAIFGGVEYQTPWDRLRLKLELDGNDYRSEPGDPDFEAADSRINLGAVFRVSNGVDITAGWERGNTAMIGITFSTNLTNPFPRKFLDPEPEARRALPPGVSGQQVDWADVSSRLKDNAGFAVEDIAVRDREVIVTGEQTTYRNEAEGVTRAARILDNSLGEGSYDWYTLVNKPRGMAISETSIRAQTLRDYEDHRGDQQDLRRGIVNATPSVVNKDVLHTAELDKFDWGLNLGYKQNMGGPDGFILYQFLARVNAEYRFTRNSWIRGNLGINLLNNWDKFELEGESQLPQVRTHIREYLTTSDVMLENLQYTWTRQLDRDVYAMAYGGLLENMFGGVGGEVLYRPFDSSWAIGVDANWVKQRGFRQDFSFRDYSTWTGHVTTYNQTPFWDVLVRASAGRYLAGDYGGTLDLSRRFANGVTVGAWATRTDVSAEEFGEGSFDKGIYFTIPFDAFFARSTNSVGTIAWAPVTRDGGARLVRQYHLYDLTKARDIKRFNDGFGMMMEQQ